MGSLRASRLLLPRSPATPTGRGKRKGGGALGRFGSDRLPARLRAPQRPMAHVIRAAVLVGWWALIMTVWATDQYTAINDAYAIILKVRCSCAALFFEALSSDVLCCAALCLSYAPVLPACARR